MGRGLQVFWAKDHVKILSVFEFPPDFVGKGELDLVGVVKVDPLNDVLVVLFVENPGEKH